MQAIIDSDKTRMGELLQDYADTFKVRRTTIETLEIHKGYGVVVDIIYAIDHDRPVAFDTYVVEIGSSCTFVGDGTLCVKTGPNSYVPVENFGDDEDDWSSSRFFETEKEATVHVENVTRALSFAGLECY